MEDKKNLPQRYIRTPFAFTRFNKNLSLLQQAVLVKVSERLQPFLEDFFSNKALHAIGKPRPLFSEAAKNSGVTQFNISYAELGVSVNNYYAAKKAIEDVLNLKVYAPGFKTDEKGEIVKGPNGNPIPSLRTYNVFSYSEVTQNSSDKVLFNLNLEFLDPLLDYKDKRVVDYVFDMTQDYVSHPDNIAFIGEVERMPMIYYLLRKTSGHDWNDKEIKLSVTQIKEYLGMIEYANNQIIKEAYPKFSQFRKNVLDTSIADINRLCKEGLLDVCVSYEPIYTGKRKVGNPYRIVFRIFKSIEEMQKFENEMQKASGVGEQQNLFADQTTKQPNNQITKQPIQGEAEWQKFLAEYKGVMAQLARPLSVRQYDGKVLVLAGSRQQIEDFNNATEKISADERKEFTQTLNRCFGKVVSMGFWIPK